MTVQMTASERFKKYLAGDAVDDVLQSNGLPGGILRLKDGVAKDFPKVLALLRAYRITLDLINVFRHGLDATQAKLLEPLKTARA